MLTKVNPRQPAASSLLFEKVPQPRSIIQLEDVAKPDIFVGSTLESLLFSRTSYWHPQAVREEIP
jgi:hypothetical protein